MTGSGRNLYDETRTLDTHDRQYGAFVRLVSLAAWHLLYCPVFRVRREQNPFLSRLGARGNTPPHLLMLSLLSALLLSA